MASAGADLVRRFCVREDSMKPITFPAVNKTLLAPDSMPECGNLPVFTDGREMIISCWRPTFLEYVQFLFTRRVWLFVMSAHTHPPVAVQTADPFKIK